MDYSQSLDYIKQLKDNDWFAEKYGKYIPDSSFMPLWEGHGSSEILIFAGDWCGDTRRLLPRFIKCYDAIKGAKPNLEIVWVDEKKKSRTGKEEIYKVTNVPTFIILKNNEEKGRLVETIEHSMEEDFGKLLEKSN